MPNHFEELPKLWIPKKDSCEGCSRLSKEGKCRTKVMNCGCKTPELYILYGKSEFIGICLNCRHFIIKISNGKWEHYTRAYKCQFPYHEEICQALDPNDRESMIEFNLHLQKFPNSQLSSKLNDDETKALKSLKIKE